MPKEDLYKTLGVNKDASEAELKKAFRKQAMKHHPDRNKDDKSAEAKFKEINSAYDVLSDSQKRAAYDQMGHAAFEQGMGGGGRGGQQYHGHAGAGNFSGGGFEDIFADLFGDAFGGGGGQQTSGADLRYNLSISLEDAYNGKTIKLTVPTLVACSKCDGSGAKAGSQPATCRTCGGAGQVKISQGFFNMARTCPTCHGAGQVIKDKCKPCHGQGRVKQEKTINVNIPKGVDNGTRIRLSGEGEAGLSGAPAGDLYVFITLKHHPIFMRENANLHIKLPISMVDAALGTTVEVPTPNGKKVATKIPEGTQNGQTLRLKGKGMPAVNRHIYGDLMVTVQVEIPKKLTAEQKDILKQFQAKTAHKNYSQTSSFIDSLKKFWG